MSDLQHLSRIAVVGIVAWLPAVVMAGGSHIGWTSGGMGAAVAVLYMACLEEIVQGQRPWIPWGAALTGASAGGALYQWLTWVPA